VRRQIEFYMNGGASHATALTVAHDALEPARLEVRFPPWAEREDWFRPTRFRHACCRSAASAPSAGDRALSRKTFGQLIPRPTKFQFCDRQKKSGNRRAPAPAPPGERRAEAPTRRKPRQARRAPPSRIDEAQPVRSGRPTPIAGWLLRCPKQELRFFREERIAA
jgi:hypothetical protein